MALAIAIAQRPAPFQYDAESYWALADAFVKDGSWSLWNFDSGLRGFVPALLFGGLRSLAGLLDSNGTGVVNVFNSALFALIGTILLPRVAQLAWPAVRFGLWRRLAVMGLLLAFWRGYLNYPLTDFPALAAALVALVAASKPGSWRWLLVAGLAAGIAINLRPAFLLLVPALVLVAFWNGRDVRSVLSRTHRAVAIVAFGVGLAIVLAPQAITAHKHFGSWSPIAGSPAKLTSFQLTTGLRLQRYETFVGAGRAPQLNYVDPHTQELRERLGTRQVEGYGSYLRLIAENPLVMSGVFVRHVVNAMDQRYATPYAKTIDTGANTPMRMAGLAMFFLAAVRLAWARSRRGLGRTLWRYPLVLVATCVTTLPSAVETRFFLPLYALAGIVLLLPGWSAVRPSQTSGARAFVAPVVIGVTFAAWALVVGMIVSGTSENLQ